MAQVRALAGQPYPRHGRRVRLAQDVESEREARMRAHRSRRLKIDNRDPARGRWGRRRGIEARALLDQRG